MELEKEETKPSQEKEETMIREDINEKEKRKKKRKILMKLIFLKR